MLVSRGQTIVHDMSFRWGKLHLLRPPHTVSRSAQTPNPVNSRRPRLFRRVHTNNCAFVSVMFSWRLRHIKRTWVLFHGACRGWGETWWKWPIVRAHVGGEGTSFCLCRAANTINIRKYWDAKPSLVLVSETREAELNTELLLPPTVTLFLLQGPKLCLQNARLIWWVLSIFPKTFE